MWTNETETAWITKWRFWPVMCSTKTSLLSVDVVIEMIRGRMLLVIMQDKAREEKIKRHLFPI